MIDNPGALTPRQVAQLLQSAALMIRAEVTALPPSISGWHPAPGEWCVKEALGHIIEAERRGFAGRIREILRADDPNLVTWDQEGVARERRDCERDAAAVLDEFLTLRAASVALVERLRDIDLQRGGHHPEVGYLRINDLQHEWIHHDRNHIRQILTNVQAYVWATMGNARGFSQS